jgi:tetratricopeptide (TPR) repeat protein
MTSITAFGRVILEFGEYAEKRITMPSKFRSLDKDLARAAALQQAGRWRESDSICRNVLRMDPDNVDGLRLLAMVANHVQKFDDANIMLQRAIELESTDPRLWLALGDVYWNGGKNAEAVLAYEKGLEIDAENGPLLLSLGNVLRTIGKIEAAIASYEKCIALHPSVGEIYFALANLKTYRFDERMLQLMRAQLDSAATGDESATNLHFALGKACEDRQDYAGAFEHYKQGNAIRRQHENYDANLAQQYFERIRTAFSSALPGRDDAATDQGDAIPIFVVGMPRSGSTLIEQILASHSQVEATRELADLPRIVQRRDVARDGNSRFPETFADLPPESLLALGQQYLEATSIYRTGRPYFVDKLPNNFALLGAIRLMLPRAKVINARRHPLSSCFGSYKQLFYGAQSFSYELSELAQYYLQYQQLMDHWHATLPGFVLDVHYEALVSNQESETRRLLDFCGLPFEESCLRFYDTKRAIDTASSDQVRQPLYSSSIDAWRPFEPYIGELIERLEPILLELPPEQRPLSLQ